MEKWLLMNESQKHFYNRWKTTGNHGNMPPFYVYTAEKLKVIGDKHVESVVLYDNCYS